MAEGFDYFAIMSVTGHKTISTFKRYNIDTLERARAVVGSSMEHGLKLVKILDESVTSDPKSRKLLKFRHNARGFKSFVSAIPPLGQACVKYVFIGKTTRMEFIFPITKRRQTRFNPRWLDPELNGIKIIGFDINNFFS